MWVLWRYRVKLKVRVGYQDSYSVREGKLGLMLGIFKLVGRYRSRFCIIVLIFDVQEINGDRDWEEE